MKPARLAGPGAAALLGGLLAVAAVRLLEIPAGPIFPRVEGLAIDTGLRLRHGLGWGPRPDPRLAPVRIDRESFRMYGSWPWRRGLHAEILEAAKVRLAPRGVVADLIFRGSSDPVEDARFEAGLGRLERMSLAVGVDVGPPDPAKRIQLGLAFGDLEALIPHLLPASRVQASWDEAAFALTLPHQKFSRAVRHLGHVRSSPDPDGVHRRFHPFVRVDDRWLPSLSLTGACLALGLPLEAVRVERGQLVLGPGGELREPLRFPLREDGSLWIDWVGPYGFGFDPVYFLELGTEPIADLRRRAEGKLWLVGMASMEHDMGPTPLDREEAPLFETHLHAMNTLLSGRSLVDAPDWLWGLAMALVFAGIPIAAAGLRPLVSAALGALLVLGYPLLALFAMAGANRVMPMAAPTLFTLGGYLGVTAWVVLVQERARQRARDAFARYFPAEVVDRLLADPEGPRLGGRRAELTILFSDIRGFTTASERVDPEVLGEFLQVYFDRMVEIVFRHRGTVDKFMGDGLMAFWGDPVELEDHAARAVAAARDMQRAVAELGESWSSRLGAELQVRIGINTGWVTVGNLGGKRRMEYTVLGRAVNLAQRLESNAAPGGILIGRRTRELLGEGAVVGEARHIQVKGVEEPVEVYPVDPGVPAPATASRTTAASSDQS